MLFLTENAYRRLVYNVAFRKKDALTSKYWMKFILRERSGVKNYNPYTVYSAHVIVLAGEKIRLYYQTADTFRLAVTYIL